MSPLISTSELDDNRADSSLVILDASFYLPTEAKDARKIFDESHIPGAEFFDIDAIADRTCLLPHMLPQAEQFASIVESLGVLKSSRIVVYDQRGLFSAARAWWMFKVFGHDNVQVLDGGLPKWCREGREVIADSAVPRPSGPFVAQKQAALIRNRTEIQSNLVSRFEIVVDARSPERFSGSVPEPRPGMRVGHVPDAISLPFTELLEGDGTMRQPDALEALFLARGLNSQSRIITMCGSGVTAAVITLGLAVVGWPIGALYDGSWAEWGSAPDTPIEVVP